MCLESISHKGASKSSKPRRNTKQVSNVEDTVHEYGRNYSDECGAVSEIASNVLTAMILRLGFFYRMGE